MLRAKTVVGTVTHSSKELQQTLLKQGAYLGERFVEAKASPPEAS